MVEEKADSDVFDHWDATDVSTLSDPISEISLDEFWPTTNAPIPREIRVCLNPIKKIERRRSSAKELDPRSSSPVRRVSLKLPRLRFTRRSFATHG